MFGVGFLYEYFNVLATFNMYTFIGKRLTLPFVLIRTQKRRPYFKGVTKIIVH